MAKRLIGYKEDDSWHRRFTVELAKRGLTKAMVIRTFVRQWTLKAEAEPNGPGEGDE